MSLTSYRAAPPRVELSVGPRIAMRPGVSFSHRLAESHTRHGRAGVAASGGPGGDLLFRALRRSTIGAEGFHGRVRDGIGCLAPRYGHQAGRTPQAPGRPALAGRSGGERRPVGLQPTELI
jgi:hypothetical protein